MPFPGSIHVLALVCFCPVSSSLIMGSYSKNVSSSEKVGFVVDDCPDLVCFHLVPFHDFHVLFTSLSSLIHFSSRLTHVRSHHLPSAYLTPTCHFHTTHPNLLCVGEDRKRCCCFHALEFTTPADSARFRHL
jgi:hypothetical protein